MAYFNNDSFYSASTIPSEFDSYQFLAGQASATPEGRYCQTDPTFTGDWVTVDQPGPLTVPSTNFPTTSYGERSSNLSIDPYLTCEHLESTLPTVGLYPDPLHSHWPMVSQPAQPDYPVALGGEGSFVHGQGWETAVPTIAPNPCKCYRSF